MRVNNNKLSAVYRRIAPRVYSPFKTLLDDAAFVISGMMPLDILADAMAKIYRVRQHNFLF